MRVDTVHALHGQIETPRLMLSVSFKLVEAHEVDEYTWEGTRSQRSQPSTTDFFN